MFDDSSGKFQVKVRFQVKVQFSLSNGWQKARPSSENLYSLNCSWTMLLSGKITNTLAVGFEAEFFAKQNT